MANKSEEKDHIETIREFLVKNPNKIYSPKQLSTKLKINQSTARSALARLVMYEDNIRRYRRGQYYFGNRPLTEDQRKLV